MPSRPLRRRLDR